MTKWWVSFFFSIYFTTSQICHADEGSISALERNQIISLPAKFVMLTKGSISALESNYDLLILLIAFLCKSVTNAQIPLTSE